MLINGRRKVEEILEDIEKMYKPYKTLEKEVNSFRDALEHHFNEIMKDKDGKDMVLLGMLFRYKPKPTYKWKKEEMNDELEAIGRIHESKKIDKHILQFIQVIALDDKGDVILDENNHPVLEPLSVFAYPNEEYVRPYPKKGKKEDVDKEKAFYTKLTEEKKLEEIEDVLTEYKVKKLDVTIFENQYKSLKEELLEVMQQESRKKVASEIGNFQILKNDPEYNYLAMINREFVKLLQYSIQLKDGKIEIYDHFSKESIVADEPEFIFDYHQFQFTDEGLFVDDIQLSDLTKEQILEGLGKLEEGASFQLNGVTNISAETLFRQLPISAGKIDKLIDKGDMHPNVLKEFRYIANPETMKFSFELTPETTHNKQVEMFLDRNMRRAQKLRYMQENAKEFLKNQFSIRMRDGKIEVINQFSKQPILTDEMVFTFEERHFQFTNEGIYVDNMLISSMGLADLAEASKNLSDEDEGFIFNIPTGISDEFLEELPDFSQSSEKVSNS